MKKELKTVTTEADHRMETIPEVLENARGEIAVTLNNDMMFHFAMAKAPRALKGLICALKGLNPADVKDVKLMNEVDYNEAGKEIVLDVRVEFNNAETLNIELQMHYDSEWIKRSLLYLCRAYDSAGRGDKYNLLRPTTHIGIMGYNLFRKNPEFYAKYLLLNVKTKQPYTTDFGLNVLSLNQIELATEEDKKSGLVIWARMFLAKTWEELLELAKEGEAFMDIAEKMYDVNADVKQRSLFEARMKYKEMMASKDYLIEKLEDDLEKAIANAKDAHEKGIAEGSLKTLSGLVLDGTLTETDAANRLNMTVEEFRAAQ